MKRIYCHIIPPVWTVRHPDMAAGWITEYVRQLGYEVHLLDLNAELHFRETRPPVKDCWERLYVSMDPFAFTDALFSRHGSYIRGRLQEVIDRGCEVFGMLLLDATARFAGFLSRVIKEMQPTAHIVAGGTGATSLYRLRRRYGQNPPITHPLDAELVLDHRIDSWVLGEGEQTLGELLSCLEQGRDPAGMRGLAQTHKGSFAPFKERALIKDLGALPHATYEGFDLGIYTYEALPFQLSRGCAFARCSHCGLKGYSRGYRVRPPGHAVKELEYLMDRYGVRQFHFTDLAVNGDLAQLEAFCDTVIMRGLRFDWQSFVQIRGDMTPSLLEKIVVSGCSSLNYGFESGSDRVLGLMRKPYDAAEAARVLRMTREAGGRAIINIMCGHPGETEREFQETIDFITENAENIAMVASVGFTSVHIHSPLLDECEAFGVDINAQGSWVSTDGELTRELRNERVHRVSEHLRLLGVPCFEAFWEPDIEARQRAGRAEEGGEVQNNRRLRFSGLQLATPAGDVGRAGMDCAEPLMVRMEYAEAGPARRVVFDLTIADQEGEVVFSTPPSTERLREVEIRGRGYVQMVLPPYHLQPGEYLVAGQMRPLHSDHAYDAHTLRIPLEVRGEGQTHSRVMSPYTWTHHRGPLPWPEAAPVRLVRLSEPAGGEPFTLVRGQPVKVKVELAEGHSEAALSYRLLDLEGDLVLQGGPLEPQGSPPSCAWDLEEEQLVSPSYLLELALRSGGQEHLSHYRLNTLDAAMPRDLAVDSLEALEHWEILSSVPRRQEDQPFLSAVELHRAGPEQRGLLHPGSMLLIKMVVLGLKPGFNGLGYRVWVTDKERIVALTSSGLQVVSPSGGISLHLQLKLNLSMGGYELHCALWDFLQDRPCEPIWTFPLALHGPDARELEPDPTLADELRPLHG